MQAYPWDILITHLYTHTHQLISTAFPLQKTPQPLRIAPSWRTSGWVSRTPCVCAPWTACAWSPTAPWRQSSISFGEMFGKDGGNDMFFFRKMMNMMVIRGENDQFSWSWWSCLVWTWHFVACSFLIEPKSVGDEEIHWIHWNPLDIRSGYDVHSLPWKDPPC